MRTNVILPHEDDRQILAEDTHLDLFRSIPWFREGVTLSGVFNI